MPGGLLTLTGGDAPCAQNVCHTDVRHGQLHDPADHTSVASSEADLTVSVLHESGHYSNQSSANRPCSCATHREGCTAVLACHWASASHGFPPRVHTCVFTEVHHTSRQHAAIQRLAKVWRQYIEGGG